ncbi:MAG: hypothetical protein MR424_03765 [Treponema sp.]|nr:hypothetical protein [Treponema sp.]MCI6892162.1 hypothetical protein [Treponema sp.]
MNKSIASRIADWGRYNTALGYSFILIGGIIAPCMIGLKFKSSKLYSDFITGKDYSIVKYLLNREYFSFQKQTFFLDKQDQVQSEEKYNQEIEKFLDILFNFDFRGSICRQNVGGYEIDESCQRVVFSLVSMISEYSEFAN